MDFFEKISHATARRLYWVAGVSIVIMMVLTCADVILREFRKPIPGTYELVGFFGSAAVAFAMAHTSVERGHVAVTFVVSLFPRRIQGLIESITASFGIFFFALIAWQSVIYANDLRLSGEVSSTLELPFYPFIYGISFSAAVVCLILLSDLLKNLLKLFEK